MRKMFLAVICVLMVLLLSGCTNNPPADVSSAAPVSSDIKSLGSVDFTGTYNRTDVIRAYQGTLEVTGQSGDSFSFYIEGWKGANMDQREGRAEIISPNKAVYKTEEIDVYFSLDNDVLSVECDDNDWRFSGNGAQFFGDYTKSDPVYTNADIIDKTFPTENIKTKLCELLGEEAYDNLVMVMECGLSYKSCLLEYSGYVSGISAGADIRIYKDKIYCLLHLGWNDYEYTFYTNDVLYKSTLPAFMDSNLSDSEIDFVYKGVKLSKDDIFISTHESLEMVKNLFGNDAFAPRDENSQPLVYNFTNTNFKLGYSHHVINDSEQYHAIQH